MAWEELLGASVTGAVFTFIANMIISIIRKYRSQTTQENVLDRKFSIEEKRTLTEQFRTLLEASESYREEVRVDMMRIKSDFEALQVYHEREMAKMKLHYESEISSMKQKISNLTVEVLSYRRENGALHLLLQDRNIDVPDWVKAPQAGE